MHCFFFFFFNGWEGEANTTNSALKYSRLDLPYYYLLCHVLRFFSSNGFVHFSSSSYFGYDSLAILTSRDIERKERKWFAYSLPIRSVAEFGLGEGETLDVCESDKLKGEEETRWSVHFDAFGSTLPAVAAVVSTFSFLGFSLIIKTSAPYSNAAPVPIRFKTIEAEQRTRVKEKKRQQ